MITRGPSATIAGLTLRRTWKGAVAVAAANVLVTVTAVVGYEATYPDPADRATLATSIGSNPGLTALFGETRALETVAGFTEWRVVLVLAVVGAVWMLFATTRVLRGEEESGRWEVLLAGGITPLRATVAALAGLSGALLILLLSTLLGLVTGTARDLGADRAALLALTLVSTPALMLGVAALACQLAQARRRAVTLGAAVLGLSYLVRVLADSGEGLSVLRWVTPLGWLEIAHPLTEPRTAPILLPYLAGMVLAGVAAALAGARDTGTGILAAGGGRAARTTGLASAMGLAARLAQGPALAWATGMAVTGMLVGLVARTAADAMADATGGTDVLAGLGIEEAGTRAYVAVSFLFITVALAVAAAGQVAATREEEASGRADMMLVRPVSRPTWLAGRVVVSLALLALAASAACLGTLVAGRAGGLGLATSDVVTAATNTLPAAVFVLGLGTLLHGVLPRLAATVTYALVAVSFLLEVVGSTVGVPGWVLGLSVLHHVAPAPAVSPDWGSAAVIVGIGVLCAGLGMLALERRDLTTA